MSKEFKGAYKSVYVKFSLNGDDFMQSFDVLKDADNNEVKKNFEKKFEKYDNVSVRIL